MMNNKPKLSIICPAYNHENFIDCFLQSFINQTEKEIELIVINDYSSDNTSNIIKSYSDNRITLIENKFNMGINSTIMQGIQAAKADIFAICASDDMLFPNYSETVIQIFNNHPNIHSFFTTLEKIDINGTLLNQRFESPYMMDKFQVLEKLFYGNFMPAPGSAFRKDTVLKYTSMPAGIFQLQDYHFHVQLLLQFDTFFHKEPLIYYRVANSSVSHNRSVEAYIRANLEKEYIFDLYYNINDLDTFMNIFKDNAVIKNTGVPVKETIPFFISLIAIHSNISQNSLWGYKSLIKYLSDKNNQQLVYDLYKFDYKSFISSATHLVYTENKNADKIKKLRKKRNIAVMAATILLITNMICFILT